jgi:hypothetical protein
MTVSRKPDRPAARPLTPKAQAAPGELINRELVASALDRQGPNGQPDGVISREELAAAGITQLDAGAIAAINAYGEQGDALTVSELAKALKADQVAIFGTGLVKIENGQATLPNGKVVPSSPWRFPEVPELKFLEDFDRQIPRLGRYNPSSPDGDYVDRVLDHYEHVKVGSHRVYDGRDSQGNEQYHDVDDYEDRPVYRDEVRYDDLARDLRRLADDVLKLAPATQDPQLKQAVDGLRDAVEHDNGGSGWWGQEARARKFYNALREIDRIQKPARPEALAGKLNDTLNAATQQVDEQARIARDVPVEQARKAISAEVSRLKHPSLSNFLAGGLAAAGGGTLGYFVLATVLAGGPLIGAAAGVGLALGGLGWLFAQLVKNAKAKDLQRDLGVLQAIDPAANRKELEQHAFAAYTLLQEARTADFLAALRGFEADANKLSVNMDALAKRAADQTKSLRTVEGWVLKAGRGSKTA